LVKAIEKKVSDIPSQDEEGIKKKPIVIIWQLGNRSEKHHKYIHYYFLNFMFSCPLYPVWRFRIQLIADQWDTG
jgi:hypothetical protein